MGQEIDVKITSRKGFILNGELPEGGSRKHSKLKVQQAIKELQVSKGSAKFRPQSLNALGTCFREKKFYDLAADQYEAALKDLYVMDSFKKEVMYNLARTYEEMGKLKEALDMYKTIYSTILKTFFVIFCRFFLRENRPFNFSLPLKNPRHPLHL